MFDQELNFVFFITQKILKWNEYYEFNFRLRKLGNPFKEFYKQVTNPDYNATTDVYAAMFFCDFINFFIVVFGYTAFGPQVSKNHVLRQRVD